MRFDWSTLALQTANLLVLLWLLRRFLFRPVVEIIGRRRAAAEKLLADADAARAGAAEEAEAARRDRAAIAAERARAVADAHDAAQAERAGVLAQAEDDATKARAAALADLAQQRHAMGEALQADARRLAVDLAARLLGRVAGPAMDLAFLPSAQARLAALTPEEKAALAPPGEVLTVVTAAPLDAAAEAVWTGALHRALPAAPQLAFATDPALIGGAELRGPHARLRNSWRADLDRIATELDRDDDRAVVA